MEVAPDFSASFACLTAHGAEFVIYQDIDALESGDAH